MKSYSTIDAYIQDFPPEVQRRLKQMRQIIREVVPEATEAISYGLPTFKLNGNLVHFGGFKSHIGFYPAPIGIEAFQKELAPYQSGKGTIQFPIDKPLPAALIKKVVEFRKKVNLANKKK